jgi:hypothetical protein
MAFFGLFETGLADEYREKPDYKPTGADGSLPSGGSGRRGEEGILALLSAVGGTTISARSTRVARPRPLTIDETIICKVALKRGTNVLILKVINETRDCSACVRLINANGKPVPDVKVALVPQ